MRRFRCSLAAALQLIGDLQAELKRGIPAAELRQLPLREALNLPPGLAAAKQDF